MEKEDYSHKDSIDEELSIKKQLFQSFAEESSFGVGLIGQGGKILYFNKKLKELLNINLTDVSMLKDLKKRVEPEFIHRNETFFNWFTSLEPSLLPEPKYGHVTIMSGSGIKRYLNFLILPLEHKEGLIIIKDMTKRIKTEELMRRLEDHLYHSKRLETVGLLTGWIIHDLSDLLTVILGNAEIGLMRLHSSNPTYEILFRIKEAAQDVSVLINRLLEFVQLLKMKPRVMDLTEEIQNISKVPVKVIREDIDLKIKLAENLSQIYGDPGTIIQIFVTLLANAHVIIPSGGTLSIEVKNSTLDEDFCKRNPFIIPGDYVQISIIYSGRQINRNSTDVLLMKNLQTKEDEMSLGTIYHLVKRNNGYILASNELENELCVYIFFPVYNDISKSELKDCSEKSALQPPKTILLAEDEVELRKVLYQFFCAIGYKVLETSNGEEAIQIFLNHPQEIDLIILDLMMPGMNGIDVYRNIRNYSPETPFIIITGHREESIQRYFVKDKKILFIKKPFELKDLEKAVKQVLFLS